MKVLFVCEGNMMRSQMAELFYNSTTDSNDAVSAGAIATLDTTISKRAIEVMSEAGIDAGSQHSKQLTQEMIDSADTVVLFPTEYMPDYARNSGKSVFWNVADPHYNKEKGMDFVRQVRDDIEQRVAALVKN